MLSDEELNRRKPVWIAISRLWLDTEIDDLDIRHIAQVAQASGFSIKELNEIYLYEVAPVVSANLLVPAGIWTDFDENWLTSEARKRAESRSLWLRLWIWSGIGRKLMTYATESHWKAVIELVQVSKTGPLR